MSSESGFISRLRHWRLGTTGRWSLLASIVGLVVGLCCIAFDVLTAGIAEYSLGRIAGYTQESAVGEAHFFDFQTLPTLPDQVVESPETIFSPWLIVLVMTVGGLASGVLVYRVCPEAAGAGTDAAVEAFHDRQGNVRGRVIWVKTIASAITLGTGGSGGREGPIAQIGAGVGSWLARRANLSARDRRILLAAGVGAGVGAMFRAPLAGAIFAGEILYSDADMEADVIVPAAIASIVGYSVYTQSLPSEVRYQPLFGYQLANGFGSSLELLPYFGLAIVLLGLAAAYVRMFHHSQTLFLKIPGPAGLRPAYGAFLAGIVGVGLYLLAIQSAHDAEQVTEGRKMLSVLGTGSGILQAALTQAGQISFGVLLVICIGKMITTSLSIGSGGSGGVFGPSMVIGGCAGAAFGKAVQAWFPDLAPHPEAYAVVGMAGFFAGVARAPISTILMIRELTGDFSLLVPTLLVSTLTFIAAGRFRLYQKQVPTRMDSPAHRGDFLIDVLEGLSVEDVYRKHGDFMLIDEGATLDDIVHRLAETNQHYFPVVDREGSMIGIFSHDDVRSYLYDETLWGLANAADVMTTNFVFVHPADDLNTAMQKFTEINLDELPVMDHQDSGKLLGFLRRKETIAAYNQRLHQHRQAIEQEQA